MISATLRARVLSATLIIAVAVAGAPVLAQTTGVVKGTVTNAEGKPVDKAKVTLDFKGGINMKRDLTTNKKGEFIQVGLQPGPYLVTATKDGVGVAEDQIMVALGTSPNLNLTLRPAANAPNPKDVAFRKVFNEGVTAAGANKYDEAIAKFTEAAGMQADCYACHMNIGNSYYQKDDMAKAEASFKKAAEIKPDEAKPYQILADIYNASGRREEAAAMAGKAAGLGGSGGGASAQDLYNQGVILWNAGKMAEAKAQFEAAIKADPNYADAQYWMGMATLNGGDMANAVKYFENYLKLQPSGQYAEQAKGVVAAAKPQP